MSEGSEYDPFGNKVNITKASDKTYKSGFQAGLDYLFKVNEFAGDNNIKCEFDNENPTKLNCNYGRNVPIVPKNMDGVEVSNLNPDESEDGLYILKSKIVPPVCPKCPDCNLVASCGDATETDGEVIKKVQQSMEKDQKYYAKNRDFKQKYSTNEPKSEKQNKEQPLNEESTPSTPAKFGSSGKDDSYFARENKAEMNVKSGPRSSNEFLEKNVNKRPMFENQQKATSEPLPRLTSFSSF